MSDVRTYRLPHVRLLLKILVRIELRCAYDPVAIWEALERPLADLHGRSIGGTLRAEPSGPAISAYRSGFDPDPEGANVARGRPLQLGAIRSPCGVEGV